MVTLARILRSLPSTEEIHPSDSVQVVIVGVTGDSRVVSPGYLFVAVPGERVDGHEFIAEAIRRGAVAVIGSRSPAAIDTLPAGVPYFRVTDPRAALASAAAALHGFPSRSLTTIGITGTDGKTTTATILESILRVASRSRENPAGAVGIITTVGARIRGAEQDTGFHVTTPDAPAVQSFLAAMREADCRYAVVESTSHGLDQQRVAAVEFDVAAVTNITHEHLDYHGSRDAYVAAKARLFRMLFAPSANEPVERVAVLNQDDAGSYASLCAVLREAGAVSPTPVKIVTYGLAIDGVERPDVRATHIVYRPDKTAFRLCWYDSEMPLTTSLIGDYNVYNILCAAAIALSLGVAPDAVEEGVRSLEGVTGRMERIDRGQEFLAIVDFAHSPASLERALRTLRSLVGRNVSNEQGRLIAVFGSAGLRDRAKRGLMGQISGRLADYTVITAEDPRTEDLAAINAEIAAGVAEAAAHDAYTIVPDRAEAIQHAVDMACSGDVVCAFGKGHERSMCFGETEYPWSDQQAMADALEQRKLRKAHSAC